MEIIETNHTKLDMRLQTYNELFELNNSLIQLIRQVESCHDGSFNESSSPILVHCSAGIGRTGCYIAISNCINQIESESMVDIMQIVSRMRQDRLVLVLVVVVVKLYKD